MIMNTASGMMEFEGQNNDFGGTKRYNNIPLVPLPWEPWDLILRTGVAAPRCHLPFTLFTDSISLQEGSTFSQQ